MGLDYGNGKTFVTLSRRGGSMEIVLEMLTKAPSTQVFEVGASDYQETEGGATKSVLVRASWDGKVLALERKSLSGKVLPTVFRWLDPKTGELVEEIATSTGGKVFRYFEKE